MTQGSCWHLVQIRTSNRQVQKWNCTIATVSSQNPTPHDLITAHNVEPTGARMELHHCNSIKSEPHTTQHDNRAQTLL